MHGNQNIFKHGHFLEQSDILERTRNSEFRYLVRCELNRLLIIALVSALIGCRHLAFRIIFDFNQSVNVDCTVCRLVNSGYNIECRCLSGTVRSDKSDDFILVDLKVEVVYCHNSAELHRNIGEL